MSTASKLLDQVISLRGNAAPGVDQGAAASAANSPASEPTTLTAPPLSEAPAAAPPSSIVGLARNLLSAVDEENALIDALESRLFGFMKDYNLAMPEQDVNLGTLLRCSYQNTLTKAQRLQQILEAL